jgi:small subunit ribosomal protein S20
MPIIKSAKKKAKQDVSRRDRNYLTRTAVRKAVRAFSDAIKAGKKAEAEKLLTTTYKVIDTAAKKKIFEKNTAARRKSLLARQLAGMKKA